MASNRIYHFKDLDVYRNLYKAMLEVHKDIIPKLPREEKYDLVDQMKRSSKSAPAILAEGFAKRFQRLQWRRYINDAIGECNEMIHHLSCCIDLYPDKVEVDECKKVVGIYEISCKQLTKLGNSWKNYHENKRT
jgi:four helix bundle protein